MSTKNNLIKPVKNPHVTYFRSPKNGLWYWNLTARNGKKTADGCEGYSSLPMAKKGLKSTVKNMQLAIEKNHIIIKK